MEELILIWCCILVYSVVWVRRCRYGLINETTALLNYIDPHIEWEKTNKKYGNNCFTLFLQLDIDEDEKTLLSAIISRFNKFNHSNIDLHPVYDNFEFHSKTINTRFKEIFSKKIWTINPWDDLLKEDIDPNYNPSDEAEVVNCKTTYSDSDVTLQYSLKTLFNRKWIINYHNFGWLISSPVYSSQYDAISINNMITVIDSRVIYLEKFYFWQSYEPGCMCGKISNIQYYSIYVI